MPTPRHATVSSQETSRGEERRGEVTESQSVHRAAAAVVGRAFLSCAGRGQRRHGPFSCGHSEPKATCLLIYKSRYLPGVGGVSHHPPPPGLWFVWPAAIDLFWWAGPARGQGGHKGIMRVQRGQRERHGGVFSAQRRMARRLVVSTASSMLAQGRSPALTVSYTKTPRVFVVLYCNQVVVAPQVSRKCQRARADGASWHSSSPLPPPHTHTIIPTLFPRYLPSRGSVSYTQCPSGWSRGFTSCVQYS